MRGDGERWGWGTSVDDLYVWRGDQPVAGASTPPIVRSARLLPTIPTEVRMRRIGLRSLSLSASVLRRSLPRRSQRERCGESASWSARTRVPTKTSSLSYASSVTSTVRI